MSTGIEALERRRPDLVRSFERDLAVTGQSREGWGARTAVLALMCLLLPPTLTPALMAFGLSFSSIGTALVAGVGLCFFFVAMALRDLRLRARARREEYRRGLSLYLDLLVMSMEAGRGHAEALPTVAGVGTGWVFDELRSAVTNARTHGISAWTALGRVGDRLGVTELVDLQASIELAQDEGGRIRDSLVSRASSMRATRTVDLQGRAAIKTDAMRNTLVLMALLTAAYVITARLLYLVSA